MKIFLGILFSLAAATALAQTPANTIPVLDATADVTVQKIDVTPIYMPDGRPSNASDIVATVSYQAGCVKTDDFVVIDEGNFSYHIYAAHVRETGLRAHCNAIFMATTQISVGTFGGPQPEKITVNDVQATP